jgi:AraC-like DNA-binding protein
MKPELFSVEAFVDPLYVPHPKQPLLHPFAETSSKVLTGNYGTILFQQITGQHITFRHYRCFIKKAAKVNCLEMEDRSFMLINLKHTMVFQFGNSCEHIFYEWAANLFNEPNTTGTAVFRKEGEYSFFTIHFETDYLNPFLQSYTDGQFFLHARSKKNAAVLSAINVAATKPMRNAISEILYYEYADQFYQVYLAVKCQELLLPFFRHCEIRSAAVIPISEAEAEGVYKVKDKILKQLHLTHSHDALARHAHLSDYKLRHGFRQIYGMPISDFQHEARMKKAYELVVDTLLPYVEIAAIVGYQSVTTFFNKFKQYTGISPKRLRDGMQGNGTRFGCRKK